MLIKSSLRLGFILLLIGGHILRAQLPGSYPPAEVPQQAYKAIQSELATGWNTWRNASMTSHVLLPEGFCLNLGIKDKRLFGEYYHELYPADDRAGDQKYIVRPGSMRSYDGTYTDLSVEIKDIHLRIQSTVVDGDLLLLISPKKLPQPLYPHLIIEGGMVWNKPGRVQLGEKQQTLSFTSENTTYRLATTDSAITDMNIPTFSPYLVLPLDSQDELAVFVSTSKTYDLKTVKTHIAQARARVAQAAEVYAPYQDLYLANQAGQAWATIYEPEFERVITPSAGRWWSKRFQGYVLWGWDFTALDLGLEHRELAYATLMETFRQLTPEGFFPNYYMGYQISSRDRSQPPVYGFATRALYQKYQDEWFLEYAFDRLLSNARWWTEQRSLDGYLCWGSNAIHLDWDAHTKQAAKFESGLDNSPMFDEAPYNPASALMEQADVGLMSLFIYDCESILDLAMQLGRKKDAKWLRQTIETYRQRLATLWDEGAGIFLNKNLQTNAFNPRVSPTNLYPLLAGVATPEQAQQMVNDYLLDSTKFYGEYMIPSISRDDPAFKDQSYWRGRIWPPMNLLVYLGLKRYGFEKEAAMLAQKSRELLLKEYKTGNWVRENYHSVNGDGTPCSNDCFGGSDCYYAWGTVFALPTFIETGHYPIELFLPSAN